MTPGMIVKPYMGLGAARKVTGGAFKRPIWTREMEIVASKTAERMLKF